MLPKHLNNTGNKFTSIYITGKKDQTYSDKPFYFLFYYSRLFWIPTKELIDCIIGNKKALKINGNIFGQLRPSATDNARN